MNQLTLGSLFDGIGGFPLAGIQSGIRPIWASEIEPFPVRVTQKRLPDMKHYGDVSKLNGGELEPVDIITFGSPCQDLSIAGKRSGLDGARSGLFREAIRIIKEMRYKTHGRYPRWAVWENVPGALSSANGRDFREVLESLIRIKDESADVPMPGSGKWLSAGEILGDDYSLAWRILDASKGWGVAQRRKRIFAVLDLDGQCAGSVLFESEGLSRYTPPSGETRKGTARGAEKGAGKAGSRSGAGEHDVSACLCASYGTKWNGNSGAYNGENFVIEHIVLNDQGGSRMDVTHETTSTLRAEAHHPPCVMSASGFCTEHSADSRSIGYRAEESPTLRAGVTPGVAIEYNPTDSRIKVKEDGICQTLCARMGTGGNNIPLVFGISADRSNAMLSDNPHSGIYEAETSRTLDCSGSSPVCHQGGMMVVAPMLASGKDQCGTLTARASSQKAFLGNQEAFSGDCYVIEPRIEKETSYCIQGSMIGRKDENGPQGDGIHQDVSFTLNTIDRHAVYTVTTGAFTAVDQEQTPPLMARDWKDPPVVGRSCEEYLVRRLTPDECCRLQGYPDGWCKDLENPDPSEADICFWTEVFREWDTINGKPERVRSRNAILKWLTAPNSDAAEYKAYGNSVAVPCVFFVLAGIVWAQNEEVKS